MRLVSWLMLHKIAVSLFCIPFIMCVILAIFCSQIYKERNECLTDLYSNKNEFLLKVDHTLSGLSADTVVKSFHGYSALALCEAAAESVHGYCVKN